METGNAELTEQLAAELEADMNYMQVVSGHCFKHGPWVGPKCVQCDDEFREAHLNALPTQQSQIESLQRLLAEVTAERDEDRQIARRCEHELAKDLMELRATVERLKGERDAAQKYIQVLANKKTLLQDELAKQASELERLREALDEILDSDELYDLLPGDGQDDYIIGEIRRMLAAKIKEKARAAAALGADPGRATTLATADLPITSERTDKC